MAESFSSHTFRCFAFQLVSTIKAAARTGHKRTVKASWKPTRRFNGLVVVFRTRTEVKASAEERDELPLSFGRGIWVHSARISSSNGPLPATTADVLSESDGEVDEKLYLVSLSSEGGMIESLGLSAEGVGARHRSRDSSPNAHLLVSGPFLASLDKLRWLSARH